MSESGDDFGGFGAPTPNRPKPVASAKPSSSRTQAGPSRNAAGAGGAAARRKVTAVEDSDIEDQPPPAKKPKATARGRKQQEREQEVEEDEGVYSVDDAEVEEGDIEEIEPPLPKPKGRAASKKPAAQPASALNGNARNNALASAAAKGKNKAKAKPVSKEREPSVEEMDVEVLAAPDEPMEVDDGEEAIVKPERIAARGSKNAKTPSRPSAKQDAEIARLKEKLSQADTHITDLTRQLQELLQVRQTEPEQLLERIEIQHQAQIRAQDNLIEDLKAKLAQSDPLLRSGKKAVFELLTRDEANKEAEKLQNQLKSYKEALRERDQSLKDKDEQIQALKTEKSDLQYELKVEIERSKTLVSKAQRQPMGSASRHNGGLIPTHQDPKMGEVIKFYEDLCNLLVPSIKVQPGRYLDTDECLLTCCYTYKDVTDKDAIPKSLYFSLRLCHDLRPDTPEPVVSMDQLVESVHYMPRELDKESPEFVASLGFLSDTFTFERDQLSLFLRTLYEFISGEGNDSNSKGGREEASDDESVELV